MSPSEHDLRSALHRGEGEPLDVDRMVGAGASARARRTRLVTVAASVVVIGGIAVTGTVLLGDRNPTTPTAADRAGSSRSAADSAPAAAAPSSASPSPSTEPSRADAAPDGTACPTSFPQRLLPGGGSPGQFGADGALFPDDIVLIVACSYGAPSATAPPTVPGRLLVTGTGATALRTSLESAAKTPTGASCTDVPTADQRRFAFVGVDSTGRTSRVVTTTVGTPTCDTRTTNGTALRYAWTPTGDVRALLDAHPGPSASGVVPRPSPSGKNVGSPVR